MSLVKKSFSLDQQIDITSKFTDNKVETLPDGEYVGKVVKTTMKEKVETRNGPASIFEIMLEIESKQYVLTYWLTSDVNMKRCLTSLKRIGFPVEQWGPDFGKPYPEELRKAGSEMVNKLLSFTRGTSQNGYPTIGLDELSEHAVMAPGTNAGAAFISHEELPF